MPSVTGRVQFDPAGRGFHIELMAAAATLAAAFRDDRTGYRRPVLASMVRPQSTFNLPETLNVRTPSDAKSRIP
jgi:hypothetical protein